MGGGGGSEGRGGGEGKSEKRGEVRRGDRSLTEHLANLRAAGSSSTTGRRRASRSRTADPAVEPGSRRRGGAAGPYLAPGFVDVHVHGGGGHDAMGDRAALDGMARHLLRHGVTSFLPTP